MLKFCKERGFCLLFLLIKFVCSTDNGEISGTKV